MLKNNKDLAVGDWILRESIMISRFCSAPWEVTKVSGNRVYIRDYSYDRIDEKWEINREEYCALKSVVLGFSTREEAEAASDKARELSQAFTVARTALEAAHTSAVDAYIASLKPGNTVN